MTDLLQPGATAAVGVLLSLAASFVAFRVSLERRLTEIEGTLHRDPPHALSLRLRDVEGELVSLQPLQSILTQYGEDAVRDAFRGGHRR